MPQTGLLWAAHATCCHSRAYQRVYDPSTPESWYRLARRRAACFARASSCSSHVNPSETGVEGQCVNQHVLDPVRFCCRSVGYAFFRRCLERFAGSLLPCRCLLSAASSPPRSLLRLPCQACGSYRDSCILVLQPPYSSSCMLYGFSTIILGTTYMRHGTAQLTESSSLETTGLTQASIEFLHHQNSMPLPVIRNGVTCGQRRCAEK